MSVAIQVVPAKRPGRKPKRATEPVVVVESDEEIEDDEDEDESENIQVKVPVRPPVRSSNEKIFCAFTCNCTETKTCDGGALMCRSTVGLVNFLAVVWCVHAA